MGALDYKTRRHRRNRLAAELAATYHPRRHFRLGQDIGWHWQFDDPNTLYRRRNRATNTGFTLGTTGAVPTDWIERGLITGRKTVDATTSSGFCMRVTGGGGAVGGSDDVRLTTVTGLTIGATHTVRFKAKNAGGTQPVRIAMASTSADVAITSSWATYTFNAVATSTTNGIFFGAAVAGAIYDVTDIEVLSQSDLTFPYQPVSTWPQAYLDAVGAQNIYAWTDTAGTIPVTAIGDGIGLLLGREYGGARGPELKGVGAVGLVGAATVATYNTSTGAGTATRVDASNQSFVVLSGFGATGMAECTIQNTGSVTINVRITDQAGAIPVAVAAGATTSMRVATAANGNLYITSASAATVSFTIVSARSVPGTHLTQATGTAKPTLSARVNRLINTERLSDATWEKTAGGTGVTTVVTENYGVAPDGTTTAARVQLNKGAGATVSDYGFLKQGLGLGATESRKHSVWMKTTDASTKLVAFRDVTADVKTVTGTWKEFSITQVGVAAAGGFQLILRGTYGTSDSADLLVWHPDLRTADDAAKNIPAYQRVGATATDHDTDGFPHAQTADGTDDSGTTATGGGNTTGFFYCGALTVSGGAGTARTIWSDTGTNTGYRVRINSSNKLELAAGNGSAYTTVQSNETITAPGTYLLSAWDDGGVLAVQVNNLAPATTTRPTVSAGTAAITVYKDNGAASSYFNGRDYGSVYRQQYPGETAHNRLKRYLANVARITV